MEFYIHTWHAYGVEMYTLVNSEEDKMNEKQVEVNEFMIAFSKFPCYTNFCHCSECQICEETSRGIGA